jgi:hypothetical protein
MHRAQQVAMVALAAATAVLGCQLAGCSSDVGTTSIVNCNDAGDAGEGGDAAASDSGTPSVEGSVSPPADSGTTPPVDAGEDVQGTPDSGADAPVDAGASGMDSGMPPVDSGVAAMDSGMPPVDSGVAAMDSGMDATVDSGMQDAGMDATVEAGTDAGPDAAGDAAVEGGTEAGSDGGLTTEGILTGISATGDCSNNGGPTTGCTCDMCAHLNGCIDDTTNGTTGENCEDLTGSADAGPAAGQSDQSLCLADLSCVLPPTGSCARVTSGSTVGAALGPCYCGPAEPGTGCLSATDQNGVCKSAIENGLETTNPGTVATSLASGTSPGATGNKIVKCLISNKCGMCFP